MIIPVVDNGPVKYMGVMLLIVTFQQDKLQSTRCNMKNIRQYLHSIWLSLSLGSFTLCVLYVQSTLCRSDFPPPRGVFCADFAHTLSFSLFQ